MFLSDREIMRIRKHIEPFEPERVRPASYEIRLAGEFRVINETVNGPIDPERITSYTRQIVMPPEHCFELEPQKFVLGATVEKVTIPPNLACEVRGKSTLGRLGLQVHTTAGWIDPGFSGVITLEFFNCGPRSILLRPGMDIGQLTFTRLTSTCLKPYGHRDLGSKYQDSKTVVEAR